MSAAPIQRLRETTVTKRKRHSTTDNAVAGPSDQRNGRINRVSSDSHRPSANASSSASFSASRESTPSVMSSVPVVHTPRRPTNSDTEIDRLRQQLTLANDQNKKLEKEVSRLKALNRSASEEDTDEGLREHEKALQELADMTEKYQEKKREYDTEKAALVQKGIAEHTNLSVLRTRLRQLTNLFEAGKYSRDEMVSTCRNLCDQLQEVADRHLTQVPVGFSSILDAMAFDADAGDADDDVDEPPAKRRRL
ncbi:hypothetical protein VKT23_008014 [Stygiomarasmius scandens]|uniref:Uncharacterized protein n=1 Tax=Marasmiellus scandens TaxID=2682957 RepID=A0ABR1JL89_9AGAR